MSREDELASQNRYDLDAVAFHIAMLQITLTEIQKNLPEIILGLHPGEEVQIIQNNRPIARLVMDDVQPMEGDRPTQRQPRIPGQYEEKFTVPDNFNDPLPDEILDGFVNPADPH